MNYREYSMIKYLLNLKEIQSDPYNECTHTLSFDGRRFLVNLNGGYTKGVQFAYGDIENRWVLTIDYASELNGLSSNSLFYIQRQ